MGLLHISEEAFLKVNSSLLISGSARSGTTILGKLIHSFENIEYVFEPPLLFSLFPMIEKMPREQWMLLCNTYLYEDVFLSSISGRGLNCNRGDDSSIFKVKSLEFIERRLAKSMRKLDCQVLARQYRLAFKLPDIIPCIPQFQSFYPKSQVIIIRRDAISTINSLMEKSWFTNASISNGAIWPFQLHEGIKIPAWVRADDVYLWKGFCELDRAAYYYIRMHEAEENMNNKIVVKYNDLLMDPNKTVRNLADKLGLSFGAMTEQLIAQVRPMGTVKNETVLEGVSQSLRGKVEYYSEMSN